MNKIVQRATRPETCRKRISTEPNFRKLTPVRRIFVQALASQFEYMLDERLYKIFQVPKSTGVSLLVVQYETMKFYIKYFHF